jgi:hypothetical protein
MALTILRRRDSVFGNQRALFYNAIVNIPGVDTLNVNPAMHIVNHFSVTSGGVHATGVTEANAVLAFAGAAGPVSIMVIGT